MANNYSPRVESSKIFKSKKTVIIQFFKFGLVGVLNTIVDFTVYLILTRFFEFWRENYLIANLISFSVAVTNSYFWNKRWTFKNQGRFVNAQFTKFYIVNLTGLVINEGLLYFQVSKLGIYDLWAKIVVVVVVIFWSFTFSKLWAFRDQPENLVK